MRKRIELEGKRFGYWMVIEFDEPETRKRGLTMYRCECDCGTVKSVRASKLSEGTSSSCGCFAIALVKERFTTHGMKRTSTYRSWRSMRSRCLRKTDIGYSEYGGRGITVCDRWRNSFENFLQDMGECPDGMSIDRIDVNGNYEPGNCRWATAKEQGRNKRTNFLVEYNGKTQCLAAWAEELGINYQTLKTRIVRAKLPPEIAFSSVKNPAKGRYHDITGAPLAA